MNTLMSMDPWRFLDNLLDAGRFPPVNVFLDDNAVVIDVELPGKTAADVDLTLEPQVVVISEKRADGGTPAWSRRLELPFRINAEKANAKFTNGILRIELPKAEKDGVYKIAIQ